jgi:PAS domain S-box-containing protein
MLHLSLMTIIWSMLAAASLVIGLMHLFLWRRNRALDYLLFSSLMAFAAGGVALTELAMAKIPDLVHLGNLMLLGNLVTGVTVVSMTWFLYRYLGTGRRLLRWAITGLWAAGLAVNFLFPGNLVFTEITGVQETQTFWGETFQLIQGKTNPFKYLADVASILMAVFVIEASIGAWRAGHRRQAGITGGAIIFFILAAGIHTPLVDAGIVKTPYLISLAFVGIVVSLNYELVRDASHAHHQAREIIAGQRRWDSLLASVQLAVVDLDPTGTIRYANPFFLDRMGLSLAEIRNLHVSRLVPPGIRFEFQQRLRKGLAGEPRPTSRWTVRPAQGPDLTFDWTSVGLSTTEGQPDGVLSIGTDVTDKLRIEGELLQTRRDLDRMNRANVLGEFVSAIAHELNQPLAAVLANAQVTKRYLTSEPPQVQESKEMLDLIIRDDKRAAEVIRRLHSLVARGKVDRENFDLNEVVTETLELCDREIRDREVTVKLELADDLPLVLAGRVEFQQIVLNLLHNALQALENRAAGQRRIILATTALSQEVLFSIEDSGLGLPDLAPEKLFSPFSRGTAGGIGLGLAISRRIVEAHGGTIRAEQVAQGGARFVVDFPRAVPQKALSDG